MKKKSSLPIAPIFEELEPRLLFSADVAEVIAAEPAQHQDLEEEPPAQEEEVNVVQEEDDNSADSPVSIETDTTESGSDTEEKNTATT
ncbi:MAG: LEPR-XLL domain-containing protein, partial [Sulfitobacter sp.]|nr:LEPR-XLL domain-containing protein [Sulfitobacter sp.]